LEKGSVNFPLDHWDRGRANVRGNDPLEWETLENSGLFSDPQPLAKPASNPWKQPVRATQFLLEEFLSDWYASCVLEDVYETKI